MKYEVERKFRLAKPTEFVKRAMALGADFESPVSQVDQYFAHPSRDFATTDEALRLRTVGANCRLTYKGPKIDSSSKTRVELELPFAASVQTADAQALLEMLGFREVASVYKLRRSATLSRNDRQLKVDLDEVRGLGTFAEFETSATDEDLDAARAAMAVLVDEFDLAEEVRTSYLEMVIGKSTAD